MPKTNKTKKNPRIFQIAFFLGMIIVFLWPHSLENKFFILSENTNIIVHTAENQTFYTHAKPLTFRPSPWNNKSLSIWDQTSTKKYADFFVIHKTENFLLGEFDGVRIGFFREKLTETAISNILKEPISLKTDFWILQKTIYPDWLPLPQKGIIFATDRKPSEKFQNFCREKNIPLLSTKEISEFLIQQQNGELTITTEG